MSKPFRFCVVTTHPIQYMAPWFRALSQDPEFELEVIFFRELDAVQQGAGFKQAFSWDIPLTDGYEHRTLHVAAGVWGLPRLLARLRKAILARPRDAVLVTGWNEPGLIAAAPLIRALALPLLLRGDSNNLHQRARFTCLCHRLFLSLASAIVVVGKANRRFYLDNGVSVIRLFDGAHFVESERMLAMARRHGAKRERLRTEFGFRDEDFVFVFVGKHVTIKRPMLLVEAATLARRRGAPAALLFAGSGELTGALRQRARELGVPAHFTGFLNQTELWRAYLPADAFVLPSDYESWGLVINEALLFGLPVIVSDQVGCGPDLVIEGETGFLFSGGAEGLADVMTRLLHDRDRVCKMGARGRRLVLEKYSMPVAMEGLKAALRAVCGRRHEK